MPHAVVFGGTGVLGRAAAQQLISSGWSVDIIGRNSLHVPQTLLDAGAIFKSLNRYQPEALRSALSAGANLLLDGLCFTAQHAQQLLPALPGIGHTVMLSSKAVYIDDQGRHINSEEPPRFPGSIRENQATMSPGYADYQSQEGYGANKVAAEQVLLDSGYPVSVVRASKVHGAGAARPREWVFLKRILDRRPAVFLANRGLGADHTTAAVNTAALIARIALLPGQRILNSADPDAPDGLEIARAIAEHMGYEWQEILLEPGQSDLGTHPWDFTPPIVLDTSAAKALGYQPVGGFRETIGLELDWLLAQVEAGRAPAADDPFFGQYLDYAAEDAYLREAMPR
ncbi:nucleoside-diphosphate-sugar epimerase [Psychromicrobium silvestre]|uniref:Nucleoside-diphosphate-sugar epimerase n=1 Tax=Psychromicrobium silvestre TaxID=1645614 RepID=A0A7Y9S7C3_9MICC|nr:reductase [Psychromicrobium silvestre]NYE95510.1 nucleoside-diphosphate-sugar epimerase [Psychromicrobium silvestre]